MGTKSRRDQLWEEKRQLHLERARQQKVEIEAAQAVVEAGKRTVLGAMPNSVERGIEQSTTTVFSGAGNEPPDRPPHAPTGPGEAQVVYPHRLRRAAPDSEVPSGGMHDGGMSAAVTTNLPTQGLGRTMVVDEGVQVGPMHMTSVSEGIQAGGERYEAPPRPPAFLGNNIASDVVQAHEQLIAARNESMGANQLRAQGMNAGPNSSSLQPSHSPVRGGVASLAQLQGRSPPRPSASAQDEYRRQLDAQIAAKRIEGERNILSARSASREAIAHPTGVAALGAVRAAPMQRMDGQLQNPTASHTGQGPPHSTHVFAQYEGSIDPHSHAVQLSAPQYPAVPPIHDTDKAKKNSYAEELKAQIKANEDAKRRAKERSLYEERAMLGAVFVARQGRVSGGGGEPIRDVDGHLLSHHHKNWNEQSQFSGHPMQNQLTHQQGQQMQQGQEQQEYHLNAAFAEYRGAANPETRALENHHRPSYSQEIVSNSSHTHENVHMGAHGRGFVGAQNYTQSQQSYSQYAGPQVDYSGAGSRQSHVASSHNVFAPPAQYGHADSYRLAQQELALAKASAYKMDLERQIEEKKMRTEAEKQERRAREAKEEADMRNYNPWGKGGAGAPLRDMHGNIVADLHKLRDDGENESGSRIVGGSGPHLIQVAQLRPANQVAVGPPSPRPPLPQEGEGTPVRNDGDFSRLRVITGPSLSADEEMRRNRMREDYQAALKEQIEEQQRMKKAKEERERAEELAWVQKLQKEQEELDRKYSEDKEREKRTKTMQIAGASDADSGGGVEIAVAPRRTPPVPQSKVDAKEVSDPFPTGVEHELGPAKGLGQNKNKKLIDMPIGGWKAEPIVLKGKWKGSVENEISAKRDRIVRTPDISEERPALIQMEHEKQVLQRNTDVDDLSQKRDRIARTPDASLGRPSLHPPIQDFSQVNESLPNEELSQKHDRIARTPDPYSVRDVAQAPSRPEDTHEDFDVISSSQNDVLHSVGEVDDRPPPASSESPVQRVKSRGLPPKVPPMALNELAKLRQELMSARSGVQQKSPRDRLGWESIDSDRAAPGSLTTREHELERREAAVREAEARLQRMQVSRRNESMPNERAPKFGRRTGSPGAANIDSSPNRNKDASRHRRRNYTGSTVMSSLGDPFDLPTFPGNSLVELNMSPIYSETSPVPPASVRLGDEEEDPLGDPPSFNMKDAQRPQSSASVEHNGGSLEFAGGKEARHGRRASAPSNRRGPAVRFPDEAFRLPAAPARSAISSTDDGDSLNLDRLLAKSEARLGILQGAHLYTGEGSDEAMDADKLDKLLLEFVKADKKTDRRHPV